MFITKYNPGTQMSSFWNAFDRDFFPMARRFFDGDEESCQLPRTNINEKEKEFVLMIEMPGVSKNDVEVSLDGETLSIEAERTGSIESEGLLRSEIRSEKYKRSFQLGSKIERDGITAKMDNGILTLTLPKKAEVVGRKIDIS